MHHNALRAGTALALIAALGACSPHNATDETTAAGNISIVASINQWGTLAQQIGGKAVTATSIITSTSAEAHDYEPTTSDIAKIQTADIIIVNGAGYDEWAVRASESSDATVINIAEASGYEHGDNPHIWFSAKARETAANAILKAYQTADASNADDYQHNFDAWETQENELASTITKVKATLDGAPYAATESVAEYLAADLGLTDATPTGYKQAAANESEPTPTDLTQFTSALGNGSISVLIYNEQAHSELTHTITDSAEAADVPTVAFTEQMPQEYGSLAEWMSALVEEIADSAQA